MAATSNFNQESLLGSKNIVNMLSMDSIIDQEQLNKWTRELDRKIAGWKKDGKDLSDMIESAADNAAKTYISAVQKKLKSEQDFLKEEREFYRASAKDQLKILQEKSKQLSQEKENLEKEKAQIEARMGQLDQSNEVEKAIWDELNDHLADLNDSLSENTKASTKLAELENSNRRKTLSLKEKQELRAEISKRLQEGDYANESEREDLLKQLSQNRESFGDFGQSIKGIFEGALGPGGLLDKAIGALADIATKEFNNAENILNEYQAKISTRLEGSGRDYKEISGVLKKNLSLSSIVKQTDVLQNLSKLVESGIAYDLEQRAFLATISQDISSTFDAFDSNLLRIIRIQREDSTYSRMGLETSLTRLFNEYFLDSSYLSDQYDNISATLIDATSQLTAAQSAEFEYTVQKWLGALYEMGASASFISQIASGINMLGTGNVQGLSGSPVQTLLAMAANRSSTDYASLLTGGLNAENTNSLLKAMVEYLAEIAETSSDNRVVAGAYSNLFGMTLADMKAVQNLVSDTTNLYNTKLSYENMRGITNQRITTLGSNYTLSKRVSTLFSNLTYSAAANLVEDPFTYALFKAADLIGGLTGGIGIPSVSVLGTGINLNSSFTDLIKAGMFGISMISSLVGGIQHLGDNNELYNWTTQGEMRGTGYSLTTRSSTSQSYTTNASAADLENQTLSKAGIDAKNKNKTISNKQEEEQDITIEDIFYGLFADRNKEGALSAIKTSTESINTMLSSSFVSDINAQRVVITGFNLDSNSAALEFPVKLGALGTEQFRAFTNNLSTSLKGADEATLYMLISLLAQTLAENGALNVNLASSSLPLTDLVTGNGTPEVTKPVQNNGVTAHPTVSRTSGRMANVRDYNVMTLY